MKTNKKQKSDEEEEEVESESESTAAEDFKIGDFVRSTFAEDGVDYEAEVFAVTENGTCTIRYIGYGNEERVKMEELVASWGPEAREEQRILAEADQQVTSENHKEELHQFVVNKSQGFRNSLPIPPMVSCELYLTYFYNIFMHFLTASNATSNVREHCRFRLYVSDAYVLVHEWILHWFVSWKEADT
jgi:Survival motor neuron protein (SMN)